MVEPVVRVLVVDDHDGVRAAMCHILEHDLNAEVVGEAAEGSEAIRLAELLKPDIVFLDVRMPDIPGQAAASAIRERCAGTRIVALTVSEDADSVASMIAAGADSFLVKTTGGGELRQSLEAILRGDVILARSVLPHVVGSLAEQLRKEQRRAGELEELDDLKREFVALVSDQLANPLTVIHGSVKTLRDSWSQLDDDVRRELLAAVDGHCELLGRRLSQILAVARLGHEAAGPSMPFMLDSVVRECLEVLDEQLQSREVHLELADAEIVGDRAVMGYVLRALIENAAVHAEGDITVTVSSRDGEAVVEVRDDGPGFDAAAVEAALEQAFNPGAASPTRPAEGLGLSLYVARRMLAAAGGRLELDSSPDGGVTARIIVPLAGVLSTSDQA